MTKQLRFTKANNIEEYWNILTHAFAIVLSLVGVGILLTKCQLGAEDFKFVSVLLFGASSVFVYLASTVYHYNWNKPFRSIYRTIDHITIYYLIAGSYSPFLLITFNEDVGWRLFIIIWGMAFLGTIFKLFFTGRSDNLSLLFYVAMGWTVLLEYEEFMETTPTLTFYLIITGGLLYCIGIVFYKMHKLKYNHSIWHLFVNFANLFHFCAVYSIL